MSASTLAQPRPGVPRPQVLVNRQGCCCQLKGCSGLNCVNEQEKLLYSKGDQEFCLYLSEYSRTSRCLHQYSFYASQSPPTCPLHIYIYFLGALCLQCSQALSSVHSSPVKTQSSVTFIHKHFDSFFGRVTFFKINYYRPRPTKSSLLILSFIFNLKLKTNLPYYSLSKQNISKINLRD